MHLRHKLGRQQLHDLAVSYCFVVVRVYHFEQSVQVLLCRNDNAHGDQELPQLMLIQNSVVVFVQLLKQKVEFVQKPLVLLKLKVKDGFHKLLPPQQLCVNF